MKYSPEKSIQIMVALLKENGINYVVASPGATNVSFVASLQYDPFFKIYSAPDERSAAYMACGIAEETGKPVVITCTGATSSRNYMPGLTEAYYRKLPILAITASQNFAFTGHLHPQFMDRSEHPRDLVTKSVHIPKVKSEAEEWECTIKINDALAELNRNGGGPVHINYETSYPHIKTYVDKLPYVKTINRIDASNIIDINLPEGKIAIFIGSHKKMSDSEIRAIDDFCRSNDAVVFCDHTSNYKGEYRVLYPIVATQEENDDTLQPDLLIHIGEISGDYYITKKLRLSKQVWRVNPDGEMRDYFEKLTLVFEMPEKDFFEYFSNHNNPSKLNYLTKCQSNLERIRGKEMDVPYSNIYVASKLSKKLPMNSVLHLGILNSLRAWNFFEIDNSIDVYSNVGGFGIDGGVSTMIGASFVHPEKLYFGVFGDLAFFYDLNCLGNRSVGNNLRILLINNGKGTEFRNYTHTAYPLGDDADLFVAAAGHYGNKSKKLVKHYVEDLGFEYLFANNKEEFNAVCEKFVSPELNEKSIVFEVFTDSKDESNALRVIRNLDSNSKTALKNAGVSIKKEIKYLLDKAVELSK